MKKEQLIEQAAHKMSQLPEAKIQEVSDFVDFLFSKIDNQILLDNAQQLSSESTSFDFLKEEEDLYSVSDLKDRYK
ncbi:MULTISPECIES: hypothetical protein [Psychroflexus]|uniref:DUF2281 domain-containing protein n=2 Tax=Psychroflexus TaxID=83612 RepID=A0A1G7ZK31_9FLAO|nr:MULTISPECIES: hypothetical protein [Psychroflexus]MBZ9779459.1 hypothetical protein [Psychroflexus longus]SDH09024.1 hypothetical protein SAMN04488027_1331 [Psychroflexus sediminis]